MMSENWGLCKDCKWWQIEPEEGVQTSTTGECIENDLQEFALRVSGTSGCNRFSSGKPARAAGSSRRRQPHTSASAE